MVIRCTEPVLRALPETVEAFLELHKEWSSGLIAALVAGGHFDENFLLYVRVEKCCLYVQDVDLVFQVRGDCKYHPNDLEPAQGGKGAAAVDSGDL